MCVRSRSSEAAGCSGYRYCWRAITLVFAPIAMAGDVRMVGERHCSDSSGAGLSMGNGQLESSKLQKYLARNDMYLWLFFYVDNSRLPHDYWNRAVTHHVRVDYFVQRLHIGYVTVGLYKKIHRYTTSVYFCKYLFCLILYRQILSISHRICQLTLSVSLRYDHFV